jgi:ATP adenylyltransferase
LEKLWAPWREKFVLCEKHPGCFLCRTAKETQDRKNLILLRGQKCFVILNRYPYNNGHVMVAPFRHVGNLEDLKDNESSELLKISQLCIRAIKSGLKSQAINLGMNLGKVSGAGVEDHLHLHIVPRWLGDTNFMPIIGETKIISVGLSSTYRVLKEELEKLCNQDLSAVGCPPRRTSPGRNPRPRLKRQERRT